MGLHYVTPYNVELLSIQTRRYASASAVSDTYIHSGGWCIGCLKSPCWLKLVMTSTSLFQCLLSASCGTVLVAVVRCCEIAFHLWLSALVPTPYCNVIKIRRILEGAMKGPSGLVSKAVAGSILRGLGYWLLLGKGPIFHFFRLRRRC